MSDNASDTREEVIKWSELRNFQRPRYIYRGQAGRLTPLRTSFERCCARNDIAEPPRKVEAELLREFKRAYHHFDFQSPKPKAYLEWLALMQHYGAPTRLLDFTYSVYIAAYFAIEVALNDQLNSPDAVVWLVNVDWAVGASNELLRGAGYGDDLLEALAGPFDEDTEERVVPPLFFSDKPTAFAYPVNPFRLNERLKIQRGMFFLPGTVEVPFMANVRSMNGYDQAENITRVVIPRDQFAGALRDLFDMNINRRTLFPDLDGYAQSLGVYHPCFDSKAMLSAGVSWWFRH